MAGTRRRYQYARLGGAEDDAAAAVSGSSNWRLCIELIADCRGDEPRPLPWPLVGEG